MTQYRDLRYEVHDRVLALTIDRAERRNTVTYGLLDEMLDAFARAEADPGILAVS